MPEYSIDGGKTYFTKPQKGRPMDSTMTSESGEKKMADEIQGLKGELILLLEQQKQLEELKVKIKETSAKIIKISEKNDLGKYYVNLDKHYEVHLNNHAGEVTLREVKML